MVVFQQQHALVELHDAGDEAEPQAVSAWSMVIEASEAFRRAGAVFRGDAVAVVGDGDHHLVALDGRR